MGLREKVALVVIAVILETSCTDCKPQSLIRNPFERFINNKENTANNVFKKSKLNGKSNRNAHQEVFKAFNFPEVDFPSDTSSKDSFIFSPGSSNAGPTSSESSVLLNNFRKEARRKRKNNVQANKDVVLKQTLPNVEQMGKPFYVAEIGEFPEVEYPLSAMDTWTPKYWNPLPYNADDPYFKTNENVYPTKVNTEQKKTDTYIKPSSMKGNKGLFAVVRNPKENKNKSVSTVKISDKKKSKTIESPNTEAPMKENNNSATVNSSLAPKERIKSKKPTKIPDSHKKPKVNGKIMSKSFKPRSQFKSLPTKTQNKNNNYTKCSIEQTLNQSLSNCFANNTNQTVDDTTSYFTPAAVLDNPISFPPSPNSDQLKNYNSTFQTIFISGECPSDVICESPNVVSNSILSKLTQHESIIEPIGFNENENIFDTETNNAQPSVASNDFMHITQFKNPTSVYSPITNSVASRENNVNVPKSFTESLMLDSAIQNTELLKSLTEIELPVSEKLIQNHSMSDSIMFSPLEIDPKISTTYDPADIPSEMLSDIYAISDTMLDKPVASHFLIDYMPNIASNTTEIPEYVTSINNKTAVLTDITFKTLPDSHNLPDLITYSVSDTNASPKANSEHILTTILPNTTIKIESTFEYNSHLPQSQETFIHSEPSNPDSSVSSLFTDIITPEYLVNSGEEVKSFNNKIYNQADLLKSQLAILSSSELRDLVEKILTQVDPVKRERVILDYFINHNNLLNSIPDTQKLLPTKYVTQTPIEPDKKDNTSNSYLNPLSTEYIILPDFINIDKLKEKITSSEGMLPTESVIPNAFASDYEANLGSLLVTLTNLTETIQPEKLYDPSVLSNSSDLQSLLSNNQTNKTMNGQLFDKYVDPSLSPRVISDLSALYDLVQSILTYVDKLSKNYISVDFSNKIALPTEFTTFDSTIRKLSNKLTTCKTNQNDLNDKSLSSYIEPNDSSGLSDDHIKTSKTKTIPNQTIYTTVTDLTKDFHASLINMEQNLSEIPYETELFYDKNRNYSHLKDLYCPLFTIDQCSIFDQPESKLPHNKKFQNTTLMEILSGKTTKNSLNVSESSLVHDDTLNKSQNNTKMLLDLGMTHNNSGRNGSAIYNFSSSPIDSKVESNIHNKKTQLRLTQHQDILPELVDKYKLSDVPESESLSIIMRNNNKQSNMKKNEKLLVLLNNETESNLVDTTDIETLSKITDFKVLTSIKQNNTLTDMLNQNTMLVLPNNDILSDIIPNNTLSTMLGKSNNDTVFNLPDIKTSSVMVENSKLTDIIMQKNDTTLEVSNNVTQISKPDLKMPSNLLNITVTGRILNEMLDSDEVADPPSTDVTSNIPDTDIITDVINPDKIPDISGIIEKSGKLDSDLIDVLPDMPDTNVILSKLHQDVVPNTSDTDVRLHMLNTDIMPVIDDPKLSTMPDIDLIPEIFDVTVIRNNDTNKILYTLDETATSETSDTNVIPNMSDYNDITNKTDIGALLGIPDTKLSSDIFYNNELLDIADTDALSDMPDTKKLSDILHIAMLPDLFDSDTVSDMLNTGTLPDNSDVYESSKMSKIEDFQDMPVAEEFPHILDTAALSDMFNTDDLLQIPATNDAVPNITNAAMLLDILETGALSSKPHSGVNLPEDHKPMSIINGNKLSDNLGIVSLPNVPGTVVLPDVSNTDALLDMLDTDQLSVNYDTVTLLDIPNTDKLQDISETIVLPEKHDTNTLTDLTDPVALPDKLDTDALPDIPNIVILPDILDAGALPDVFDADKLPKMFNKHKLPDISDTVASVEMVSKKKLPDICNTTMLPNMPCADALPDIPETHKLSDISNTSTLQIITNTDKILDISNTVTFPNISDFDTFVRMTDNQVPLDMLDTIVLPDMPDMIMKPSIYNTDALPNMPNIDKLQDIPDIVVLPETLDTNTVPHLSDSFTLPDMLNVDLLPDVVEAHKLPNMFDNDELLDISDTVASVEAVNTEKLPSIRDTFMLLDMLNTDTLPDIHKNQELPDISDTALLLDNTDQITDIPDIVVLQNFFHTNTLPDLPNPVALSDMLETYALSDTSKTTMLPDMLNADALTDILDAEKFPNISENEESPDISDAVTSAEKNNTEKRTDVRKTVILPDMPGTDALPDIIETHELTDISKTVATVTMVNTDQLTDIPDNVVLPRVYDTNTLPDLSNPVALPDVLDADKLPNMFENDESLDISDTVISEEKNSKILPEMPGTDALPDILETHELQDISDTVDVLDAEKILNMFNNEELLDISGTVASVEMVNTEKLLNIRNIVMLPDRPDTDALPDIHETHELPDVSDSHKIPDMPDNDSLLDLSDTDELLENYDTVALLVMTNIDKLSDMTDTDALPDLPDTTELPHVSDGTALPDISDTEALHRTALKS